MTAAAPAVKAKQRPSGRLAKALAEPVVVPMTWRSASWASGRPGLAGERSGGAGRGNGAEAGVSLMAPQAGLMVRALDDGVDAAMVRAEAQLHHSFIAAVPVPGVVEATRREECGRDAHEGRRRAASDETDGGGGRTTSWTEGGSSMGGQRPWRFVLVVNGLGKPPRPASSVKLDCAHPRPARAIQNTSLALAASRVSLTCCFSSLHVGVTAGVDWKTVLLSSMVNRSQ